MSITTFAILWFLIWGNLLLAQGWTYDPGTNTWTPPANQIVVAQERPKR